jgi:CubicO group peptidase (beta-lactamase class C family)
MTTKFWRSSHQQIWRRRISQHQISFYVFLVFGACSPLVIQAARAQASPALSDEVGNYVRSEMQREHIPGVALLVSRGGKIVQAQGFGFANVELQVPV